MMTKWLDRLEARCGRYRGIRNLMSIVVVGMIAVFIGDMFLPYTPLRTTLSQYIMFDKAAILRGEIWRVFTFVFMPPESGLIFSIFMILFYWNLGQMLQNDWGTFRFTLFYMCGMLGAVIAGTITGYVTNYYLNLSLFLAVAILYPNRQVSLYGIIAIRFKWLALIDVLLLAPTLLGGSWASRLALIVSLLNVLLFFMDRLVTAVRDARRRYEWRRNWRSGGWR